MVRVWVSVCPVSNAALIEPGETDISGGTNPVPVNDTDNSPSSGSLLRTLSVPAISPTLPGWNVTITTRRSPGSKLNDPTDTKKSARLELTSVTSSRSVPALVTTSESSREPPTNTDP